MELFQDSLAELLLRAGLPTSAAEAVAIALLLVAAVGLSWLTGHLCHRIATPVILHLVERTHTMLDDYLLSRPMLRAMWRVVPGFTFYVLLPHCLSSEHHPTVYEVADVATRVYISITFVLLFRALLSGIHSYTGQQERFAEHQLTGIIQFAKLLVYCLGAIVVLAILCGRDPLSLIAGLGAAAAVIGLVFRDTILGLVAGIQLSSAKMLKTGDWVTVPSLGIDGYVEEVTLVTVKIRGFDNTIFTVPPYTLVSSSFQNWAPMFARGARRVKRALFIDVHTVRFVTDAQRTALSQAGLLPDDDADDSDAVTNLTLFRRYAERYVASQPEAIAGDERLWLLARQLDPTPHGLPLELWFYLSETRFAHYERLAATIVEHLVATLPAFGLRLYQYPTTSGAAHGGTPDELSA